jgi:twitching motility protein PilT
MLRIDAYLENLVEMRGSDLHLSAGAKPRIRIGGKLVTGAEPVSKDFLKELLYELMSKKQSADFEKKHDLNMTYTMQGVARFRVSIFEDLNGMGATFRMILIRAPSLTSLRLNKAVEKIPEIKEGLVLINGPSGSGKSTTLAAIINSINKDENRHILTIEDPIEFIHKDKLCHISQREVGQQTPSLAVALKQAMRHDVDIIMVDDIRDMETARHLMLAAETGVLVLSSVQAMDTTHAIETIINMFPSEDLIYARTLLSSTLKAIVTQQLLPMKEGKKMVPANEIMFCSSPIGVMVREGNLSQIQPAIFSSANLGMITMDKSILNFFKSGMIAAETALNYAVDKEAMDKNLNQL